MFREEEELAVFEWYHTRPFYYLHQKYHDRIGRALLAAPKDFRTTKFLNNLRDDYLYEGEEAWNTCKNYGDLLEKEIERLLNHHSVFYWVHLFRRLLPRLSDLHDGKTDVNTVMLVRQIIELAILKFGSLEKHDDVRRSNLIFLKDTLGGHFQRIMKKSR